MHCYLFHKRIAQFVSTQTEQVTLDKFVFYQTQSANQESATAKGVEVALQATLTKGFVGKLITPMCKVARA